MTSEREQIKERLKEGVTQLKKIREDHRDSKISEIIKEIIEQEDRAANKGIAEKIIKKDRVASSRKEPEETL